MLIQVLRVEGSKSIRVASMPFFRCPKCGDCQDIILPNGNGMVECAVCQTRRPKDDFKTVSRKVTIARCARCGQDVPFVPSTMGIVGPLCSSFECSNYVAVAFGKQFFEPKIVLDPIWNRGIVFRAEPIAPGLLVGLCRSKRDQVVLTVLQVFAKQDDDRFKFGDPSEFHSLLCLDSKRRNYIGFLIWTEDKTAVLRQIFVVRGERRKGHASSIVSFWVENFANKLADRFGIEEPNESAMKLHAKLGHLKLEGSTAIGVKCHFVRSI